MGDIPRKVGASEGYGSRVASTINALVDLPLSKARQIDLIYTPGDDLVLIHGLGRPVRGFLLVYSDQPIDGQLHEDLDAGVDRSTHLVLTAIAIGDVRKATLSFLVW